MRRGLETEIKWIKNNCGSNKIQTSPVCWTMFRRIWCRRRSNSWKRMRKLRNVASSPSAELFVVFAALLSVVSTDVVVVVVDNVRSAAVPLATVLWMSWGSDGPPMVSTKWLDRAGDEERRRRTRWKKILNEYYWKFRKVFSLVVLFFLIL